MTLSRSGVDHWSNSARCTVLAPVRVTISGRSSSSGSSTERTPMMMASDADEGLLPFPPIAASR